MSVIFLLPFKYKITGYIPSRKFHFSDTYKVESDICIDDFLSDKQGKLNKDSSLINNVLTQSKHIKIADNSDVKRSLDNFKDVRFKNASFRSIFCQFLLIVIVYFY